MTKCRSLHNGEAGFCQERWQFWKLRFSKLKDEVDKDVAEMAQQAVCAMEALEKRAEEEAESGPGPLISQDN